MPKIPEEEEILRKMDLLIQDIGSDVFWYPFFKKLVKPRLEVELKWMLELMDEWKKKYKEVI